MLSVKGPGGGGKNKFPTGITVETPPTKTTYTAGEMLDVTGIKVKATFSDNTTKDITTECIFTPTTGTVLYEQDANIGIAWEWESTITYHATQAIIVNRVLQSIAITSQPIKTTFYKGDTLDLSGMVVTATFTSGMTEDVTESIRSVPVDGSELNEYGTLEVSVSYADRGITKTDNFIVHVSVKIVTWAIGTDQEVADMVAAADAGVINLRDYWAVGQERKVSLSAMSTIPDLSDVHAAQNVTMVLMHVGGKTLESGKECSFIVGQKNGLSEYGAMNKWDDNAGGWNASRRRAWCNEVYKSAIPESIRSIFKPFKNITADGSGSTKAESIDYFALPAEKEIFGSVTYANAIAESELKQFDYYKTSANRVKKTGDSGSANFWWERSPYSGTSSYFCYVNSDGTPDFSRASNARLIAPFGCI